jgi:hypothetical protein
MKALPVLVLLLSIPALAEPSSSRERALVLQKNSLTLKRVAVRSQCLCYFIALVSLRSRMDGLVYSQEMIGRKRSLMGEQMTETFEAYRTRVLSYLGDEEPIGVQRATPSQLDRRLRDVAPEELIRRPAPEKWSVAEIVAHLADAELAMGWRLRNMLANPGVALSWWDQAAWAERLGYAQQDVSFSTSVFRTLRESNLRLLESVPRTRWVECYGVHEVRGLQTVEEFVRLEASHDLNHLRQIDRILGG